MSPDPRAILEPSAVRLGLEAKDKADALRQCGEVLTKIGAASPAYADAMLEREESVSTYIGEGVAIPHGTNASREHIERAAIAYLQFPHGVDWDGNEVQVCIAIASRSEEHVDILQSLATVLMDPESAAALREASSIDDVMALLSPQA
ncbi:PTS sugar transporter subunit IIA [Demequina sp. TTPB684]|uniref:PTS sugar transporter subunit IIA n=1 Tax=unclassified Demequina TaxID=2620311 RepID=UPI001CF44B17|nr:MULTISPECIES: PTS sugar transporter subunit IIA [unclassified Demequina]MCB2413546.1 PTS sugar transporter subunit IIA [Demequina sp. TTPB684]UPU87234.1 PTS sugar transporter subunit IIA [Demequina sp. TMPB413]